MIDLVYDTETTGRKPRESRLVQLAYKLIRGDDTLWSVNLIVNPGVPIPKGAVDVHGITTEHAETFGVDTATACAMFSQAAKRADNIVAHNLDYDRQIMEVEFDLLGKPNPATGMANICTMKTLTNVLKLPGKYGKPKWPTLAEAYEAMVSSSGFDGAHDAMADVEACVAVLRAIRQADIKLLPYTARA